MSLWGDEPVSGRLVIDLTRCRGHGICMLLCADRIELDEWGFPAVDSAEIQDRPLLRRARRAAAACPTGALRVEERRPVEPEPLSGSANREP